MKRFFKIIFLLFIIVIFSIPISFGKYYSNFSKKIILNNRKPEYTIKFNGNSGIGYMDDMHLSYGVCENLSLNTFIKDRFTFIGWNTLSGIHYNDGEEISNLSLIDGDEIELFAEWFDYHVYFQVPPDWNGDDVYVYLYNDQKQVFNNEWPGKPATLIDSEKNIYAYEVDRNNLDDYSNIIFIDLKQDESYDHQTIDLSFSPDKLGKLFAPELFKESCKLRIYVSGNISNIPRIHLWKRDIYGDNDFVSYTLKDKISGYGFEYIIDLNKYNMFKLSVGSIQTDEIMVPEVQDLTYYINWKSHTVRRFYYDGLWYDYDDWYATYYNLWMNDDYIKFSGY